MMQMKTLYKNKITRIRIFGVDWHLWVECVRVGFYVILARM